MQKTWLFPFPVWNTHLDGEAPGKDQYFWGDGTSYTALGPFCCPVISVPWSICCLWVQISPGKAQARPICSLHPASLHHHSAEKQAKCGPGLAEKMQPRSGASLQRAGRLQLPRTQQLHQGIPRLSFRKLKPIGLSKTTNEAEAWVEIWSLCRPQYETPQLVKNEKLLQGHSNVWHWPFQNMASSPRPLRPYACWDATSSTLHILECRGVLILIVFWGSWAWFVFFSSEEGCTYHRWGPLAL